MKLSANPAVNPAAILAVATTFLRGDIMIVGSFGDVVFEVSNFKVLTVKDFRRDTKANYTEHKVINGLTILEYLGRDLEQITFSVTFHQGLGINNVLEEAHRFRQMAWNGEPNFLIIGGHAYTENRMVITDLSENVEFWTGDGHHLAATMEVTLKEYAEIT